MTTDWQRSPRMTPREQQIEALAWAVRDTWTDEDEYSPWTVAAALLDGPVARMIADAEQAAERRGADAVLAAVDALSERAQMHDTDGFKVTYVEWLQKAVEPFRGAL